MSDQISHANSSLDCHVKQFACGEDRDDPYEMCIAITAKICNFSNEEIHNPAKKCIFKKNRDDSRFMYALPEIYANDIEKDSEGYVSVDFSGRLKFLNGLYFQYCFTLVGTVAVVDASGEKQYLQPFSYRKMANRNLRNEEMMASSFDKYIKRTILMDDPANFLLEDCLTLEIEATFAMDMSDPYYRLLMEKFKDRPFRYDYASGEIKIFFDTEVGRRLWEVSSVYGALRHHPTLKENHVSVPFDDFRAYMLISYLILGSEILHTDGPDDIRKMCLLADDCGIPSVIDSGKLLIEAFCLSEPFEEDSSNITREQMLTEFCSWYDDDRLKGILLRSEGNPMILPIHKMGKQRESAKDWICERNDKRFIFSKRNTLFK